MTQEDYYEQEPDPEEVKAAAYFLHGIIASVPPDKREALNRYASQSADWNDVLSEADRLRSAPPVEPAGPDLTRRQTAGGGLTVERYKSMSSEERAKLSPAQIDAMTSQLARRGR
jgi:hypothetical protein